MKRLFQKRVGWWRLRRGYCPACNSDAPEIDRIAMPNSRVGVIEFRSGGISQWTDISIVQPEIVP